MILEYVSIGTGKVLDTVTVPDDDRPIEYATGGARSQIAAIQRVVKDRAELIAALDGWTNGYVQLRASLKP